MPSPPLSWHVPQDAVLSGARPGVAPRVLVVEDEFFIADDIAGALRALGAEVVGPVPCLADAMAMLDTSGRIDFAVLDLNLEGEAGFPVGDALAARGVPFVFATGYDRGFLPPRFRDVPYWEKPFEPRLLATALRNFCGAATGHG